MAISESQKDQILKVVVGMFNGAPGGELFSGLAEIVESGASVKDLASLLAGSDAFRTDIMAGKVTTADKAGVLLDNFGLSTGQAAGSADALAEEYFVTRLDAGDNIGVIVYDAIEFLSQPGLDPAFVDVAALLNNKATVAGLHAQQTRNIDSVQDGQDVLANVTDDADFDAGDYVGGIGGSDGSLVLTHNADNLVGGAGDDEFFAPVTQNETGSGQLANTFETGDVLDGGGGHNILRANLIDSGSISDGAYAPAISATTTNIQEVYLRQQSPQTDATVNRSTIDAEKMAGVEQWWTENSRSDIQIEDIRSETADTTFGMRETDPGVSFNNFFNVGFLEGDTTTTAAMTLNIYEGPLGAPDTAAQLEHIKVHRIDFTVDGNRVTLETEAIKDADTWDQLEAAIQSALDDIDGTETITLTNRGNGQFVFEDTSGRNFEVNDGEALLLGVDNNVTATNSLVVGREDIAGATTSSAILDYAGNGSQGGTLNIGAMSGLRGIEDLDLSVDRDSHLQSITSYNNVPGQYNTLRNGMPNEFLEKVTVNSIGANGDLTVGRNDSNRVDGRMQIWGDSNGDGIVDALGGNSGFVNIRELNTDNFNGSLNVAITLDNDVIGRYLDPATEAVTFSYNGGDQDDIINIADISDGAVSGDKDFAMDVDMGAGDDRLIIDVPVVSAVSVDGGDGENTIVVANSHGTEKVNTFENFANFQSYEIEADKDTKHDFTSMPGIENVIVATELKEDLAFPGTFIGVDTQLINLEADQDVTVSGKNQANRLNNSSTNDQEFGKISLTNDTGADRTITLENTARLSNESHGVRTDGVLTVNQLVIDESAGNNSATRDVTIDSAGGRDTGNAVASFEGRDVETLKFLGTQDLTVKVDQIADQASAPGVNTATALDINGSALEGDLSLALNAAMINNWGDARGLTDRVVGTAGDNDTLMIWGNIVDSAVNVSGFETIQFGSVTGTMFGDLAGVAVEAEGVYNARSTDATHYVITDDDGAVDSLILKNLGEGVTVDMGDSNRNANGDEVNFQIMNDNITLLSGSEARFPADTITVNYLSNIQNGAGHTLKIGEHSAVADRATDGYEIINLNVTHAGNLTDAVTGETTGSDFRGINLDLNEDARELILTGGADNNEGFRDGLTFTHDLPNNLTKIDLSGYEGVVTLKMADVITAPLNDGTDDVQTDVLFVMSEDNAAITLTNLGGIAATDHNSVFKFTGANTTSDISTWTINEIIGANQVDATIDNITRFDVSGLGISAFNELNIDDDGAGTLTIRSEAQVTDTTMAGGTVANPLDDNNFVSWQIEVTGIVALDATAITSDNFIFV